MKRISPYWLLLIPGLLLVGLLYWYGWDTVEVELPTQAEPSDTTWGRVIEVSYDSYHHPHAKYFYEVNGQFFWGNKKIDRNLGQFALTGTTTVSYNPNNPKDHQLIDTQRPAKRWEYFKLFCTTEAGYDELILQSDLFALSQFGGKGKVLNRSYGEWGFAGDTLVLVFYPFNSADTLPAYHDLIFLKDTLGEEHWQNLNNGGVYKSVNIR